MGGKAVLPLFLLLLVLALDAVGQQGDTIRSVHLRETLDAAVAADPAFGAKIDLSVNSANLSALIKNIAQASGANLNISASGERTVTCNFKQVRVSDIIRFLCLEYSLDVELIEKILLVKPYLPPVPDAELELSYVSFGKGTEPITSTGILSPGVDVTLGASTINRLINTFNGFGSINLGKVGPNFYLGLKLLEEKGRIVVRSTPRLSTLNGHKAELKSGEKKYYKEIQSSIIGTQNPMQSESFIWKDTEANLTLDILPYVSLDSCITLEIEIVQSEFTERESGNIEAPPGTITRSFKSIIKVKDQEMVLLGGIEKNTVSKSSKGLPFIARVPVLKWIFGKSAKNSYTQKLNVFVKPTII